ncbi:methyltransferase domain-containing protein [Methanobacterium paludis]|uniref:Methyltransferase type 11 n=1 Tax=Methanobacterium paludis (strain DSM 25820 / JCM 18151 / SWAN1) TaxID=868131 RepID=F6D6S1_METPW|nr:methyltransferase domain-containing protein [Methanobacterium paludis]AEG18354.1 Methyltransferase type 11 [Methanobacterium paludis]
MRESVKELVKIFSEKYPIKEPVFEFGSFQVPEQKDFADMRHIFPGKTYFGCDMRSGPGVDLILDLHNIDLSSKSAGTVLILDTFEHVEYPRKAIKEVYRIMKSDGIVLITSVMNFPIHEHPSDYWRFTPEGFKSLLEDFKFKYVDFVGNELFPHTVVGIGAKDLSYNYYLDSFKEDIISWKEKWKVSPYEESQLNFYSLMKSGIKNPDKIPDFLKEKIFRKL